MGFKRERTLSGPKSVVRGGSVGENPDSTWDYEKKVESRGNRAAKGGTNGTEQLPKTLFQNEKGGNLGQQKSQTEMNI